jgi:hypothetical protein
MYLVRAELRVYLREQIQKLQDQGSVDFSYTIDEEHLVNMIEDRITVSGANADEDQKHKKLMFRLELEFEKLSVIEMQDVLDVQMLQFEE